MSLHPLSPADLDALRSWLEEAYPETLLADGFEMAILGVVEVFGRSPVVLYDRGRCIGILVERDGMTHEEAEEFFDFNVSGAYVGPETPAFALLWQSVRPWYTDAAPDSQRA